MNKQITKEIAAVAPIHGISMGSPADKSTWRIDFKDEATTEQRAAANAILNAFDAETASVNDSIEQQIAAIYAEAPPNPRAFTELAWAICAIVDRHNQQISELVGVIRQIGGPAYADFDVSVKVPDLKRNKGMVTVKSQIDRTTALRAQKQ